MLKDRARIGLFILALFLALCGMRAEGMALREIKIAGFSFKVPANWEDVPANGQMRKAELRLRGKDGEASCVFFFFGSDQGGDVKSNVERWAAQFTGAEDQAMMATQEFGSNKLTLMKAQGNFDSAMPGSAPVVQPNFAMVGAILEGTSGKVFVKMTGPLGIVKSGEAAFTAMVKSAAAH